MQLLAGWQDLDMNGHMRNAAYLEKAVDVRLSYFASCGFGAGEFARLQVGPVIMSDEARYHREVGLLKALSASMVLAGLADDGGRLRLRNEFHRADGKLAARIDSVGGWLDLAARRLVAPPPAIAVALRGLARSDDYAPLPSSLR